MKENIIFMSSVRRLIAEKVAEIKLTGVLTVRVNAIGRHGDTPFVDIGIGTMDKDGNWLSALPEEIRLGEGQTITLDDFEQLFHIEVA
jgi:hypothetical protein